MIYSRQREIILNTLRTNPVHPTTDELHEMVKGQDPNISIATVYRNLNQLAAAGKVFKISNPNGADRFDFTLKKHYHVQCVKCGSIFDVDMDELTNLKEKIHDTHGMEFLDYDILFKGICSACKETAKGDCAQ